MNTEQKPAEQKPEERIISAGIDDCGRDNECPVCGSITYDIETFYSDQPRSKAEQIQLCTSCREEFEQDNDDETLVLGADVIEEEFFAQLFAWADERVKDNERLNRVIITKEMIVTAIKCKDIKAEDVMTAVFEAI